jgi:uncharacterized protein YjiS (DUF1127 family)
MIVMTTQTLASYGAIGGETNPVKGLFARVASWIEEQRRYARTVDELSHLTDRELADIGLERGGIDLAARNCVRGRG